MHKALLALSFVVAQAIAPMASMAQSQADKTGSGGIAAGQDEIGGVPIGIVAGVAAVAVAVGIAVAVSNSDNASNASLSTATTTSTR